MQKIAILGSVIVLLAIGTVIVYHNPEIVKGFPGGRLGGG